MVTVFNVIFELSYYFGYTPLPTVCLGGTKEWSGYIEGSTDSTKSVGSVFRVASREPINDDGITVCPFETTEPGSEYKHLAAITNDPKEH